MFRYINKPVFAERALYEEATRWTTEQVVKLDGLKSFYRFGNITAPGISDLDFLAVFKDGINCTATGFEGMPEKFRPLFTHGIMAISESHYADNCYYSLWSEHHLIAGIESYEGQARNSPEEEALKIQTAVEFLAANYIDLKIQLIYKTINLRSFLQHMKGIIYDLEYLGISSGRVYNLLAELKHVILHWFTQTPSEKILTGWIIKFDKEFDTFCDEVLQKHPLYFPKMNQYQVSRNAEIIKADSVSFRHDGFLLPSFMTFFGKKSIRLQNRFSNFRFRFPITHEGDDIIKKRFAFLKEMKSYNRKHLPGFMTITTSITSKII